MNDMRVNILGTDYQVMFVKPSEYENLNPNDGGLCDHEKRIIVINTDALPDAEREEYKVTLRHEIIHAYLFECGLGANWEHPEMGHDETYVDWIAMQFPKILRTFRSAGCL